MMLATGANYVLTEGWCSAPSLRVIVEGSRDSEHHQRKKSIGSRRELLRNAYRHAAPETSKSRSATTKMFFRWSHETTEKEFLRRAERSRS